MKASKYLIAVMILTTFISFGYAASNIGVTINGTPVMFKGMGPQMVGGRVLVPLRGVFEQMGAFVGWDTITKSVVIQTGSKDITIPAGSKTAKVNGLDVPMDTPVLITAGTTMVPLRFVGETLGAGVKWNSTASIVEILLESQTAPVINPPVTNPPETIEPSITSFRHSATDWLKLGDKLTVTMQGTPAGTATFEIPGVVPQQQMKEITSGKYEASWNITAKTPVATEAIVLGKLSISGQNLLIQAGNSINIDPSAPIIKDMEPQANSNVSQTKPSISATFNDGSGSGININSVKMTINGKNVSDDIIATNSFVSYKPNTALISGENEVEITISDKAGNINNAAWKFTVKEAAKIIKSITYTIPENAGPGDVIAVRIEGETKHNGKFWIVTAEGKKINERQMIEESAGIYTGEYTIKKSDDLKNSAIVGSLTSSKGEVYTLQADKKIGVTQSNAILTAPQIIYPTEGISAASPVIIKGKADPGATIKIKITYSSVLLGAIQTTGTLGEQVLTAGEDGSFQSAAISLSSMLGGKTEYELTAVSVGANETESETVVVNFKKK